MSDLRLQLPDSLHEAVRELAAQDGVSIDQFVSSAIAEKIAALKTVEYLRERAAGAEPGDWDFIFAQIPHVEPEPRDRLPADLK